MGVDLGGIGHKARLEGLARELTELASRISAAAREPAPAAVEAAAIHAILGARRHREEQFPAGLLCDPAWDMLLALLAARLEERRLSVTDLCAAAPIPATTALRWIQRLEEDGLAVRTADPEDRRRWFIEISEAGSIQVQLALAAPDAAGA